MIRLKPYAYVVPSTIEGAWEAASRWGEGAKFIAGGTDLVVQMKRGMVEPRCLISLRRIRELRGISENGDGLSIGTMTSLWELEKSSLVNRRWPFLTRAVSEIGSPAIRHVGTIGGNICNASPAADSFPALLVCEARLRLRGPSGERVVPLSGFFVSPSRTILDQYEMLHSILLPALPEKSRSLYLRLGRKAKADLALAGVAIVLVLDNTGRIREIRIGLGGVAPTVFRTKGAEAEALGKEWEPSLIRKVAWKAAEESQPVSDIRGSADYKRDLVKTLVTRGLTELGCVGETP